MRSKVLGPPTRQRTWGDCCTCVLDHGVGGGPVWEVYSPMFEIKSLSVENVKLRGKGRTSNIQHAVNKGTKVSSERSAQKELCYSSQRSSARRSCFQSLQERFPRSWGDSNREEKPSHRGNRCLFFHIKLASHFF